MKRHYERHDYFLLFGGIGLGMIIQMLVFNYGKDIISSIYRVSDNVKTINIIEFFNDAIRIPKMNNYEKGKDKLVIVDTLIKTNLSEVDDSIFSTNTNIDTVFNDTLIGEDSIFYGWINEQFVSVQGTTSTSVDNMIKKEEMVNLKKYRVFQISGKCDNELMVEFWKSPLNYVGYKLLPNKLILFGLFDYDNIVFKCIEGDLYMYVGDKRYKILLLDEFSPFILDK